MYLPQPLISSPFLSSPPLAAPQTYPGNLSEFVKQKPEAKAYYELSSDNVAFNFPEPGPLEGVKSLTKAVLKTKNLFFQYPTAPLPQVCVCV